MLRKMYNNCLETSRFIELIVQDDEDTESTKNWLDQR